MQVHYYDDPLKRYSESLIDVRMILRVIQYLTNLLNELEEWRQKVTHTLFNNTKMKLLGIGIKIIDYNSDGNTTHQHKNEDSNIKVIKMQIPPFKERNDLEVYLE